MAKRIPIHKSGGVRRVRPISTPRLPAPTRTTLLGRPQVVTIPPFGMTAEEFATFQKAGARVKFDMLLKQGLIPKGSTYAGADKDGNPTYYGPGQAPATLPAKAPTPLKPLGQYTPDPALMVRIDELQRQVEQAQTILDQGGPGGTPWAPAQAKLFKAEIDSARAKVRLISAQIRADFLIWDAEQKKDRPGWEVDEGALAAAQFASTESLEDLLAVIDPEVSPFVQVSADGSINVDVILARRANLDPEKLKVLGVTKADIREADAFIAVDPLRRGEIKAKREAFEGTLREQSPVLFEIYQEKGIEGYNEAISAASTFMEQYQMPVSFKEPAWVSADEPPMQPDLFGAVADLLAKGQFYGEGSKRIHLDVLYGSEAVDRAVKLHFASVPTIGAPRKRPPVIVAGQVPTPEEILAAINSPERLTAIEYALMVKPETVEAEDYLAMVPFVAPTGIDTVGAINAGVPQEVVQEITGLTKGEYKDYQRVAEGQAPVPLTAGAIGAIAAEVIIPGVFVAKHWNELSNWERAGYIGLDILSLLPIAGWFAKAGGVSARTAATVGRGGRAIQAVRSVSYAARVIPKGMLYDFPVQMLVKPAIATARAAAHPIRVVLHPFATGSRIVGPPARALAGLARITAEPLIHPLRTFKTITHIASGKIQLGNFIPAGTLTMAGAGGRTVPLRTVWGAQVNILKPPDVRGVTPPVRTASPEYIDLRRTGRLPFVEVDRVTKVTVPASATSRATYDRLLAEGKLVMGEFWDAKGAIVHADPVSGIKTTYTKRLPTYWEWKGKIVGQVPSRVTTVKDRLTPAEYEVYKLLQGKKLPPALAQLTLESVARHNVVSIETMVRHQGFKAASDFHGIKKVTVVYPDAPKYIAAEVQLQKVLAPGRAAMRQRITKATTKFLYESLLGGKAGSESEWNRLARAGLLQTPVSGQTITEVVIPSRSELITELARVPASYTVMEGGAWRVDPLDFVPKKVLGLQYPVYITDPSIMVDVWALRSGTIKAYGEGYPMAPGAKIGIKTQLPMPVDPIMGDDPAKELKALLENQTIFAQFSPGSYRITATGQMVALAGGDYQHQARYLAELIIKTVADEGYGRAMEMFGMIPVLAVYPAAIEMAVAEEEATWELSPGERRNALNKLVNDERIIEALDNLSPDVRAEVLRSIKGMADRFTEFGSPTILKPEAGVWTVNTKGELPAIEIVPGVGAADVPGAPTATTETEVKLASDTAVTTLAGTSVPVQTPVQFAVVWARISSSDPESSSRARAPVMRPLSAPLKAVTRV